MNDVLGVNAVSEQAPGRDCVTFFVNVLSKVLIAARRFVAVCRVEDFSSRRMKADSFRVEPIVGSARVTFRVVYVLLNRFLFRR